ncbi:MAG: UDP-N-acetylglucosamine 1-carboxyvinyltransferase, partial [Clostridia bacterium]|nr:UDP-N-acetylglucosamine 1-carboxyvinyltransferase [Clostridia bacterium]
VVEDRIARVAGVKKLIGAQVSAADLRGGAALVTAALGADGMTTVFDTGHITRGYENLDIMLQNLGADLKFEA